MPAFMLQVFELFDSKKTNVIDFSEFTMALSVFHPKAPLQEKAACKWNASGSLMRCTTGSVQVPCVML